jgi:hypothetical protein
MPRTPLASQQSHPKGLATLDPVDKVPDNNDDEKEHTKIIQTKKTKKLKEYYNSNYMQACDL